MHASVLSSRGCPSGCLWGRGAKAIEPNSLEHIRLKRTFLGVDVAGSGLVLRRAIAAVADELERIVHVVVDAGVEADVELVAVPMRVRACTDVTYFQQTRALNMNTPTLTTGMPSLGAARDGHRALAGRLQCHNAVNGARVDLIQRRASRFLQTSIIRKNKQKKKKAKSKESV